MTFKMKKLIIALVLVLFPSLIQAKEGFTPIQDSNVFLIKGATSGATIFLVNLPNRGKVLMTQVHVLEALGQNTKLFHGIKFGWFFKEENKNNNALELPFKQEIIWKNDELDVAILKVPDELIAKSNSLGLEIAPYKGGEASLIGYPIIGKRTYPKVGKFWTRLGEFFGSVEQMESSGNVWKEGDHILSDIDALSGNSGGPILNEDKKVIGIIHKMKTWHGIGYRYLNPHIEVTSIDEVLKALEK
ncbi:MAG: trypsin-like peptidase domain-containing protein [Deltaproteobacteria bacterium]|nr:trypsin-like peptidase domain-containing protein [Deltaproteobacteria bacterium]